MITIDNAHPDDIKAFDMYFWKDPEVIRIMQRIENYQQRRMYVQTMQEKQRLDKLRRSSFEEFIKEYDVKVNTISLKDVKMPDEMRQHINKLYITIYMACDIIESGVLDLNDAVKKIENTMEVVSFDDLKQLTKAVKEKLNYLQRTDNYLNIDAWGDKCDKVYEFMQQKAQVIINAKLREDKKRAKNKE
jgi:hypothetical protein